ncbi:MULTISPECIES: putative Ig domain-containing protein [Methylococcus]|uniref:Ig domain-containing protein n=1 Tax=Methylococcus capsulatus TaxID=414 RepID=A0ABZ2F6L3_METCP|nr:MULTISPECIES: putative Ig domain-containing protein [Methylococcus]MDF9390931.1 cytochrome C [Methylococcus capsulatus]
MSTSNPALRSHPLRPIFFGALLIALASALIPQHALAAAKLKITRAAWSDKTGTLVIKGKAKDISGPIEIYDINGRLLGDAQGPAFTLNLSRDDLPAVPCAVRVKAGGLAATKPVKGAAKGCSSAPTCQITSPADSVTVNLGDPVTFTATANFSNPQAKPQYEWDFSGGAMGEDDAVNDKVESYKRATGTTATVKFVRGNSRYRVHFSAVDGSIAAMESKQYRCEDTVEIVVGNPPTDVPDMTAMVNAAQQSAPKVAKDKNGNPTGKKGDLVVLPYEDLTMQCSEDMRQAPGAMLGSEFHYGSLNAVVYQKDLKSPQRTDLKLRYAAASSAADPAASASINSTSQNWPLGSDIRTAGVPMGSATIKKTDRWDSTLLGPDVTENLDYSISRHAYDAPITPDQGIALLSAQVDAFGMPTSIPRPTWDDGDGRDGHGRRMPGFDAPYQANAYQDFTAYFPELAAFQARFLPLTDVDDSGRVNPYPLLRVQAVDPATGQTVMNASGDPVQTDGVQTAGTDFHCRECHAKGKIGADPNTVWQPSAYLYTLWSADANAWGGSNPEGFAPPQFFDAVGLDGNPSTDMADQERAAMANILNLHAFYDAPDLGANGVNEGWKMTYIVCGRTCHSNNSTQTFGYPHWTYAPDLEAVTPPPTTTNFNYDWNYSLNMHRWHGELQYNANKDGILRDERGVPKRWDLSKGYNLNTLFPVKNPATGEILPMEQNCLKCHSGQREQCYRDRMYTAGVTCYQCHGDMLAVGQAYPKPKPGPDGHHVRTDSFDQPDCGSCHVGSANVGKAGADFFSAGVRKLAFDANDLSATTLPVDWSNPDASRFAVPPTPVEIVVSDGPVDARLGSWAGSVKNVRRVDGPLFRLGKDTHGNVPCAACHGGAHAVWPNRDPNANDNVTALQLQGHVGQILECNVCHDEQAFKNEKDLDGGIYMTQLQPDSGVLGGPHNIHPINDPYWWKSSGDPTDTTSIDGSTYGGWHNNYAKKPGAAGEDQCAACHGNDHKGTRLSRTPVDRVFDFSGFNMAKLKKAGFKKKVIKVAAGTFIGCDTCHSIATSCKGSPAGDRCGQASDATTPSTNRPPVFTAEPGADATTFVYGQTAPYSYTPAVTDPDGDTLTFGLSTRLDAMSIDANTGTVTVADWTAITGGYNSLPYTYRYMVTVKDGKGGYASQQVAVTITCPDGNAWGYNATGSVPACLANTPPTLVSSPIPSVSVGQPVSLMYDSTDPERNDSAGVQRPNYFLEGAPDGAILGQYSGVLHWTPTAAGTYTFTVKVSDQAGGTDSKTITLHVCEAGQTWSEGAAACIGNHPPTITSTPSLTVYANQLYAYAVEASDADGDTLQFSLSGAPAGMSLAGSILNWTPTDADAEVGSFNVTVIVIDGKGGVATQALALHFCSLGQTWDSRMAMCM